ncbi:MAG TPA: hypothetical protein ENK86_06870 [Campylobacterales bacterium]|nr:hypothetical protein [Campylobacterales bacterium]
MRKMINALLIVDIGIIAFCLMSGERQWFINSQIAFWTSSLVMLASIISYRNMVQNRLEKGMVPAEDNRDTIDKIEDPYDVFGEEAKPTDEDKPMKEIVQEEKARLKRNKRSIWQVTRDSKAALSIYRMGAYGLLIMGFFYLNNENNLHIPSYLSALAIPPIVMISTLLRKK